MNEFIDKLQHLILKKKLYHWLIQSLFSLLEVTKYIFNVVTNELNFFVLFGCYRVKKVIIKKHDYGIFFRVHYIPILETGLYGIKGINFMYIIINNCES